MRIGFLGKGGSGKTSLSSAYLRWSSKRLPFVAGLDLDVNAHVAPALGWGEPVPTIGKRFDDLTRFLEPSRTDYADLGIQGVPGVGTVPPTDTTRFIQVRGDDPFWSEFGTLREGIGLITVGPHDEHDFAFSCFHYNLNTAEIVIHRLIDRVEDRVVFDSAAGSDFLGTSLYMTPDLTLFVVEPTAQSASVYKEYKERVAPLGIPLRCVGNKIRNGADERFLFSQIPVEDVVALFPRSQDLRAFEQGDPEGAFRFMAAHEQQFAVIDTLLLAQGKDWDAYHEKLVKIYQAECKRWWDRMYGVPLSGRFEQRSFYPAGYSAASSVPTAGPRKNDDDLRLSTPTSQAPTSGDAV